MYANGRLTARENTRESGLAVHEDTRYSRDGQLSRDGPFNAFAKATGTEFEFEVDEGPPPETAQTQAPAPDGEEDFGSFGDWFKLNAHDLLEGFLKLQLNWQEGDPVPQLRAWQQEFLEKPLEKQVNSILQLPPGEGKTLLAQWIMLEQLAAYPAGRIVFAVPLRVLARQLTDDIEKTLDFINQAADQAGVKAGFKVQLAEGPGATVNLITNNVLVATYEHAAGELRKDPTLADQKRYVSLVVVDEVHNIAKGDRGMVIDDVLFFANQRRMDSAASQARKPEDQRKPPVPAVLAMSGTLPGWVSSRLVDSYPELFWMVYTPELLGINHAPRPKAARMMLDRFKFDTNATVLLIRDIVKTLLWERLNEPPEAWRRLVVFMSSVAEAELAYVMVATDPEIREMLKENARTHRGEYAAPVVKLVNTTKALADKFGGELKATAKAPEVCQLLMEGGVYIHHAQLKGAREIEDEEGVVSRSWSDALQEQLASKDFVAVFSTSTLSVGINLNSTQIGVLGPNTMWTIDQAEQMIGRVGRVDRDVDRSFVLVVDSPLYHAPGVSSILVPDTWFVPRIAASLGFRSVSFETGERGSRNLDIRGFFRPENSAHLEVPDAPASGLLHIARDWSLIDDNGRVTEISVHALNICKQDLRSLPATIYLLKIQPTENAKGELVFPWLLVLLWAVLVVRPPNRWDKIMPPKKPDNRPLVKSETLPDPASKQREHLKQLIRLYGEAHQAHPADTSVPGTANAEAFLVFFRHLFWSVAGYPAQWFTADPADLVEYALNLTVFLNTTQQDVTSLVGAARGVGANLEPLLRAFAQVFEFLNRFVQYAPDPKKPPLAASMKTTNWTAFDLGRYNRALHRAYLDLGLPHNWEVALEDEDEADARPPARPKHKMFGFRKRLNQ